LISCCYLAVISDYPNNLRESNFYFVVELLIFPGIAYFDFLKSV